MRESAPRRALPGLVPLPDELEQVLRLVLEIGPVPQARPLDKEVVILGCRHNVLNVDGDDDIEQAKLHQQLYKAVEHAVAPAVGGRDHHEDGLAVLLRALAHDDAAEEREKGLHNVREAISSLPLLGVISQRLREDQGHAIQGDEDEHHGIQQGLPAADSAVDHHQQVAENLQPQDPQKLGEAQQSQHPDERGLRRTRVAALVHRGNAHLYPGDHHKHQLEVVPPRIRAQNVGPSAKDAELRDKLDGEYPCEDRVHNDPHAVLGVKLTAEAQGHGIQHDHAAHDRLHDAQLEARVLAQAEPEAHQERSAGLGAALHLHGAAGAAEELRAGPGDDGSGRLLPRDLALALAALGGLEGVCSAPRVAASGHEGTGLRGRAGSQQG
mmetsp:Transcript_34002/g.108104  ORF Transcript_34002/g.108104 Transcript_34002/m.108104 type:complete len:382 (+) Transcript_34002:457-1602(+)